ncbi:hypothetical protein KAM429_31250 [Aquipseudomonas alcaligenes]|uniref:Uncharacterized protein n=2 Tax=Aquipseudomonas alcaligenes TaxID=43263 RepID=A0AA37FN78_AQUAC|nr:hypothetical protein KAM426_02630 [Pseudomonas alcaligenes]GIZ67849.1 hypothetical protein KAM428_29340 [Pseudomonas alcaligenes]GIZ72364.1 hypothetical protein KAM429_31250 [Pseudomonas alcaligenes]GIZ76715.1 hypothetical protein KAM430_31240 [Pseudomonas alcaligenes]GIZ80895.1 hypothetical protein KAM432_29430 [Pseudomonas alcaligenes]
MNRNPLIRLCFSLFIGIAASLSAVAQAAAMTAAEQVQVYASRATSSLLLVRGEGFQEEHLTRLEKDIADLETSAQAAMSASSEIPGLTTKLVTQLRLGVSFGPNEDNMPWEYPQDLARALRELLTVARGVPDADPLGELPAQVEYLAVQYLSRSYIGSFEIAREQPDNYVGQDERILVPQIDKELGSLDGKANPAVAKLQTRWKFLRAALMDMNSGSNALASASGRAFAPTTVDRHTRSMTGQWMGLGQVAGSL